MPAGVEHAAIALLGHLADSALRALTLASVVALVLAVLRVRSAPLSLSVWTAVLGAALLMPVVGPLVPAARWSLTIALPPRAATPAAARELRRVTPAHVDATITTRLATPDLAAIKAAEATRPSSVVRAPRVPWPLLVIVIYLTGSLALCARMILAWFVSRRVIRRAVGVSDPEVLARLRLQMTRMGVARRLQFLEAVNVAVPVTTGVRTPAIILPADWRGWSSARLDMVLAHELSHVARRDALTQRASLLYRALYWFNPFSWWLHRRLVELAEHASDDAVLATGVDPAAYAETLLAFFVAVRGMPGHSLWEVAMASRASAERRVERILSWRGGRARRLAKRLTLGVVVALAPIALVAATGSAKLVPTQLSALPEAPQILVASRAALPPTGVAPPIVPQRTAQAPQSPAGSESLPPPAPPQQQTIPGAAPRPDLGPPGRNDFADRQMVDFVFDLRTLPNDDLKRAATTASIYVDQMWTRADVGLEVFHVAAVHVMATTFETVQDFTWDQAAIQRAIASVGARTGGTGATGEVRLKNLAAMCDGLAQRQATDKLFEGSGIRPAFLRLADGRAVMYFGNGVIRNMDALLDVADLARACTKPNLWFFSISGATFFDPLPPLGNPVGVSLEIVQHQADSPLTLLASKSTLDYGFATVTVQNNGFKAIKSFTLAALVRPNDTTLGTPQIFTSQASGVAIPPKGALMVSTRLIDGATLASLAVKGAKAQLGVVDVEFDDGSQWTYDLKTRGEFLRGFTFTVGDGTTMLAVGSGVYPLKTVERAAETGRIDTLTGLRASDVPPDDPFAAGAHRLPEPALEPPHPSRPLILGDDRTKTPRVIEIDAIVDATGHVLRVRTARSVDDSPGGIDQRALVLVRDTTFTPAHFSPARFNGEAVTVLIRAPVLVYY